MFSLRVWRLEPARPALPQNPAAMLRKRLTKVPLNHRHYSCPISFFVQSSHSSSPFLLLGARSSPVPLRCFRSPGSASVLGSEFYRFGRRQNRGAQNWKKERQFWNFGGSGEQRTGREPLKKAILTAGAVRIKVCYKAPAFSRNYPRPAGLRIRQRDMVSQGRRAIRPGSQHHEDVQLIGANDRQKEFALRVARRRDKP